MEKQAWEGYAEAEKYDTTWDKNLRIPDEDDVKANENKNSSTK